MSDLYFTGCDAFIRIAESVYYLNSFQWLYEGGEFGLGSGVLLWSSL